jgi:hypothetical protein
VSAQAKFTALGRRFKVQSALHFAVEHQVAHVNGGVDHRSIQRARPLQGEVGMTLHREAIQMNLPNARYVEILPDEVKPEDARRRRIGCAAGDLGLLMGEMNIVERRLAAGDAQVGVELLDRFPVGGCIHRVNMALRLGMRPRS